MELTLETASLDTGSRKRDEHLRCGDFFDADRHPDVVFHSTSAGELGDGRLQVQGELEAAGEHVALQLEVTVDKTHETLELDAATTVDRRQLGMTWSPLGMARTPTALTVHARLLRAG
jgi:polyisoprenoid-binding protein YceI